MRAGGPKHIDWSRQPLGEVPDRELAAAIGVSGSAVHAARKARGIPACNGQKRIDWNAQPLGKEPDVLIAERLGVGRAAVSIARKRRGIPCPQKISRRREDWVRATLLACADELGGCQSWRSVERLRATWRKRAAGEAP